MHSAKRYTTEENVNMKSKKLQVCNQDEVCDWVQGDGQHDVQGGVQVDLRVQDEDRSDE